MRAKRRRERAGRRSGGCCAARRALAAADQGRGPLARRRPAPSALPRTPVIVTAACGQMATQWPHMRQSCRDHRGFPLLDHDVGGRAILPAQPAPDAAGLVDENLVTIPHRASPPACAVARIRPDVVADGAPSTSGRTRWRASGTLRCRPCNACRSRSMRACRPRARCCSAGSDARRCRTPCMHPSRRTSHRARARG